MCPECPSPGPFQAQPVHLAARYRSRAAETFWHAFWHRGDMADAQRPIVVLRRAVARGDGPSVVAVLPRLALAEVAQLAGEGLLVALAQSAAGAKELAASCIKTLRDRDWEGDGDLAAQLAAAGGDAPAPSLRAVPVDLEVLSDILEGDGSSGDGRLDLLTGAVWSESALDYAEESGEELPDPEDPERWLYVGCEGSQDGYRDMEAFISTVEDDRADRLAIAISGPGAFRRFRDVLERWPEDQERFIAFAGERRQGRARSWLVAAGIVAVPASLDRTS